MAFSIKTVSLSLKHAVVISSRFLMRTPFYHLRTCNNANE